MTSIPQMKITQTYVKKMQLLYIVFALVFIAQARAENLYKEVQLSGFWKFSIGDDKEWAAPDFDDSDWDVLRVPGSWEEQGYEGYNGYAWYRKKFVMGNISPKTPLYLIFGNIDDADKVYLNGHLIAKSGSFPPSFETAYNQKRKYLIPHDYLNPEGFNTLAVRIYDTYRDGGIIRSPVGIYTDEDYEYLNIVLAGKWKFHLGDNLQWSKSDYIDDLWNITNVPSPWEHEGYTDYDGYAWYRKEFRAPESLNGHNLYLCLGKIDDYDHVYLNGERIGSVFELKKDRYYRKKGYEYRALRMYKIPQGLLNTRKPNIIAVRVYDGIGQGGIYQGPVGIMTEQNHKKYMGKYYGPSSFWESFINDFFID